MIKRLLSFFTWTFKVWTIDILLLLFLFFVFGTCFSIFQNYFSLQEFKSYTSNIVILNKNPSVRNITWGNIFLCWNTKSISWGILEDSEFWIIFDWIALKRNVETLCETWYLNNKWWKNHLDLHYKDWCDPDKDDKYQSKIFYESVIIGDYVLSPDILANYVDNKNNYYSLSGSRFIWENESSPNLWDQSIDFYWINHWKYCVIWLLSWDTILPIKWKFWKSFSYITWDVNSLDSLKESVINEKSNDIKNSWDVFRIFFPLCINFICFTIIFFITFSFSKLARSFIYTWISPILLIISYMFASLSPHNFYAFLLYPCIPLILLVYITHAIWLKRKDIENWAKSTEVYLVDSLMKKNRKN